MILSQHQEVSKQDLTYFDDEKKEKYIPYVHRAVILAQTVWFLHSFAAHMMKKNWKAEIPRTSSAFPSGTGSG